MQRHLAVFAAGLLIVGCSKSGTKSSSSGSSGATTAGSASNSTGGSSGGTTSAGTGSTTSGSASTSGGSTGASCTTTLSSLVLAPANQTVNLTGGTAAPITFTASDGSGNAVDASLLTWTATRADDTDPGTISDGVYQPNPNAGGTVTISATGCGASASTTVTFTLQYTPPPAVQDGGAPIGSGDFGGTFTGPHPDGGAASPNAPKIYYPSDQTRFPRNIYKVLFQWSKQGNALFRLTFTGASSTVTVYTDGNDPQCAAITGTVGCWQADTATWTAIAGSNAGSTVTLEVDGTPASGGTIFGSSVETLGFSRRDVPGAIFYWAADVGGVQRATVSDSAPENYLVGPQKVPATPLPNGDTVACAACHSVSRDGKVMAVSGSASGTVAVPKGVWTFNVTPNPPPTPIQLDFQSPSGDSFASFSPDDLKLIYSPRNGGPLLVLDVDGGNVIAPVVNDGGAVKGIAPDWSPLTDEFAYADMAGNIASVSWDGSSFSPARILAGLIGGKKNAYPRYASEGDWVAFTSNNSLIYVVPADVDGGAPLELSAANRIVNNAVAAPSENSMPTWAPPGDLRWVAFNSQRPYGKVTTGGNNQIWVAAVDFSRLDAGEPDPSYPAFRLPFQALDAKNHRAFWVQDVRATIDAGPYIPPDAGPYIPPDAGSCVATGDACDPNGAGCCDQAVSGAFCGPVDGGNVCEVPIFQ